MKRDLELIRIILLQIEQHVVLEPFDMQIDGYEQGLVNFHLQLLDEAGLIEIFLDKDETGSILIAQPIRITWNGYEFLDMARNNSIWEKSKKFISQKSISVSISLFIEVMKIMINDLLQPNIPK